MKGLRKLWLVLLLALLVTALPAATASAQAGGEQVQVTVAALNVRQGPGTTQPVLTVVYSGQRLAVLGRDAASGWYQVQLAGGRTGWVSGQFVQIVTAGSPATGSSPASSGHHLVFQTASGGAIYVLNPDGTGLRYLTDGMDPALSPDGQQVAFTRWDGSADGVSGSLWVINIDGTGLRQVLGGGVRQPKSPTWSPDGSQIAFSLQAGGTLAPSRQCLAPGQRPPAGAYDFSRENGQLCFMVPADPYWGLEAVTLATGAVQVLPRENHSFTPTWDPAQPWRIVFHGDSGLVNLDLNRQVTYLLDPDVAARGPAFSPDGSKLAINYLQSDHWEVHVMNADGTGEVRLTETPLNVLVQQELQGVPAKSWNNAAPAWSPDGSQIAFVSDRSGHWAIWAMNADGSDQHLLFDPATAGLTIQYHGVDERVITWR